MLTKHSAQKTRRLSYGQKNPSVKASSSVCSLNAVNSYTQHTRKHHTNADGIPRQCSSKKETGDFTRDSTVRRCANCCAEKHSPFKCNTEDSAARTSTLRNHIHGLHQSLRIVRTGSKSMPPEHVCEKFRNACTCQTALDYFFLKKNTVKHSEYQGKVGKRNIVTTCSTHNKTVTRPRAAEEASTVELREELMFLDKANYIKDHESHGRENSGYRESPEVYRDKGKHISENAKNAKAVESSPLGELKRRGNTYAEKGAVANVRTQEWSKVACVSSVELPITSVHVKEADMSGLLVDPEGNLIATGEAESRWRSVLGEKWFEALKSELKLPYMRDCLSFVRKEREIHCVYPPSHLVFEAFRRTPLDQIKLVVVGQDPYHQRGQAMGLAFSVPKNIPIPPSLQNILKEVGRNYPESDQFQKSKTLSSKAQHGDLTGWAQQGVFLMNSLLTVREGSPMSHKAAGWERFTSKVISLINTHCDSVVFFLWGKPAQRKSSALNRTRHLILEAGHPSPLSVRFFEGKG